MQNTTIRQRVAGVLLLLGLIAQIIGFTGWVPTALPVSYLLWVAVVLLWRDIPRRSRIQAGVLIGLGLLMLVVARVGYGAEVAWFTILQGNVFVVSMLVGVSFISLIGKQGTQPTPGSRVTGAGGVLRTWLGVHFLGTILNLSTVLMVGDRLARRGPLTMPQLLALNRGLSSAALWSPFFASMAVVIALVPEVQYGYIALVGFPLAMLAGVLLTLTWTTGTPEGGLGGGTRLDLSGPESTAMVRPALLTAAAGLLVAAFLGPVARRVAGVPIEHLVGWVQFGGLRLSVGPGVFVPRPETEVLVDVALAHVDRITGEPDRSGPVTVTTPRCDRSTTPSPSARIRCSRIGSP